MAIVDALRGARRAISFQDVWGSGGDWQTIGNRHAGIHVSTDSAAQLSAVYGAWRIISEAVGTLPRNSMRRIDGRPKPFFPRPVWLDQPNPVDSWVELAGQTMVSLLASGNGYLLVRWGGGGVEDLTVLDSAKCRRVNQLFVEVTPEGGSPTMFPVVSPGRGSRAPLEVLHFRGMTKPGQLHGMSPIMACAESMGVSLAAQRYGSKFFANDGTPGGVIEIPESTKISAVGQAALREAWHDLFGGPDRAKKVAVLTEGAKFKQMQVSPNEAQFLETRKFGVSEIARIYGVPNWLLGDTENTTGWGTAMAEQNTAFVVHTLRPWLERLEAKLSMLLQIEVSLSGREPEPMTVFVDLNEEALLRGATKERWEVLRANVASGIMTADEARKQEGLDPLPGGAGSVPWVPLAQAPKEPGALEGVK